MKDMYIKKVFLHTSYDLKVIEDYLENMAAKGLMFVKQIGIFFYFKKCEPAKLRFCVDVFGKASIFDTRPEAATLDYITYCEESGWHHIYSNGKLQYFFTDDDNVTPIQTDNSMRLKLINSQTIVNEGFTWIILSVITLMQLFSGLFQQNLVKTLILNETFIMYALFPFILIPQAVRYLYFYIKNKRRTALGQELEFYSAKNAKAFMLAQFIALALVLFLVIVSICSTDSRFAIWFGIIFIVFIAGTYIFELKRQRQKYSRIDNIVLTVITTFAIIYMIIPITLFIVLSTGALSNKSEKFKIYDEDESSVSIFYVEHAEIPITFDNIGISFDDAAYNSTSKYSYRSFFGTYDNYNQYIYTKMSYDDEAAASLEYDIVNTPYDFIINSYVRDNVSRFNGKDISSEESGIWGALEVYALSNQYSNSAGRLVVYESKVIYISSDSLDFSPKNIRAILDAMP